MAAACRGTRSDSLAPTVRKDAYLQPEIHGRCSPEIGHRRGFRITSDIITMPKAGNTVRRARDCESAPNDRYVGLVLLFSTENGEPLAIMPDGVMQRFRVGAANGLGVKYLARKNASSIGILGAGWQAGTQLLAACAVREIKTIRCFSPTREKREAFCKEMSGILNIEVQSVDQPETALRSADIALCATSREDPVFSTVVRSPGQHVGSIRKPEIELDAVRQANRVIAYTRDMKPIIELQRFYRNQLDEPTIGARAEADRRGHQEIPDHR